MERISGKSIQQLATEYRLPRRDVELQTQDAWETSAVDALKGQMLEKLGTMVLAVYETQLRLGSLEAARDLALSFGLLKKPGATPSPPAKLPAQKVISSVEDYRLARQSRKYRPPDLLEDAVDPPPRRRIDMERP